MDEYERRFQAALNELSNGGVWTSNANPPYVRLYRKMGVQPRPPHYVGFLKIVISLAVWFGSIWCFFMWNLEWSVQGMSIAQATLMSLISGSFFGLMMALYYAWGRKKYNLHQWDEL